MFIFYSTFQEPKVASQIIQTVEKFSKITQKSQKLKLQNKMMEDDIYLLMCACAS